ncbi:MAG: ABC transporter ATP-binding protein [Chloroflexota bacterium]
MNRNLAIQVKHLSKQYRIGAREAIGHSDPHSLRETLAHLMLTPYRRLRSSWTHGTILNSETVWALKDVSFEVKQGEVVGVIGANGAGKSTLLKILSRITEPTEGHVTLHGRVGSLLEVGTGFHAELTGRENIYLNGAILGMKHTDIGRLFDEIVAFAEVEKFIDTPVKHYSSGMYLRLAFAVAAHLEPEILLVDEVLAVGDAAFQKKCLGKMNDVAKTGRTVLFVSHSMAAIRTLCTKGILLKSGQIDYTGDISTCIQMYLENSRTTATVIAKRITYAHEDIQVQTVRVNESENDELTLPAHTPHLKIDIIGHLEQPKRMEVEVQVRDAQDTPLAFYSPGHEHGQAEVYPSGDFHLVRFMEWPQTMQGDYYLDLYITDPNIRGWVDIPSAVRLVAEGIPMQTGAIFDYYKDKRGWLFLRDMTQDS